MQPGFPGWRLHQQHKYKYMQEIRRNSFEKLFAICAVNTKELPGWYFAEQ